jgi:hypothetical protein
MDFDAYLQSKGYPPGSKVPKTTANQLHAAWLKESGGGFQPKIVEVPVPGQEGATERAFMSSPNSATLMRDPQSRVRYEVGNDGNLYMVDGTTAAVVTNAVGGAPLQPNPKSSAFADMMQMMGQQPPAAAPAPSRIKEFFGFGGQPSPTPAPTPAPTPMAKPEAAGAAMTNAPTAAPTPAVFSVQQYQQMTGQQLPPGDYADANGRPFSIR